MSLLFFFLFLLLCHVSRGIRRCSAASDGMTHQSGAPVTGAAPLKERLLVAAGEGAQIFSRCRRRRGVVGGGGGHVSTLSPPRVCISALSCHRRCWKIPRLDDARPGKTPARWSHRRKTWSDYCCLLRQNSAIQKIRNDDVFSSRKVS